ncbi:Uncharacterised protein [Bordetella pertussis]|nr:Uncharacterised protein [Bordetella pertussis]
MPETAIWMMASAVSSMPRPSLSASSPTAWREASASTVTAW